jgi:hypothetical protein
MRIESFKSAPLELARVDDRGVKRLGDLRWQA